MESKNAAPSESRESSVAAMLGTAAVMAISAILGLVPLALMVIGGYTVIRWIFG